VGSVLTFDDVTDLVVAQRTAAWADVARRIAHEIKNPLTPIQLAAERLRKKYAPGITKDRETFDRLTTTIERQVGDLKAMVDEFAEFARMPKPEMARHDLRHAVQEPVVLFREGHPEIRYELKLPDKPILMSFDRRLITRAVTNLVKNASEAIEAAKQSDGNANGWKGHIETIVTPQNDRVTIEVIDNGVGLPKHNRNRLLEPYVTTKGHKGTGLGLAMVQKITEQHGGTLALEDAPQAPGRTHGALVRITLPLETTGSGVPPEPTKPSTRQMPAQQA
jgi:two-component system nitrogen regulation sensor histidine kinase NtrY